MTKADILNIIIENSRYVLPTLEAHDFDKDDELVKLGANSIDRIEIVAMTLSELSLRIPLVDTITAKNIGQLADLLHDKY